MDRWVGILRRYGLALLLCAAMIWVFFSSTLPALKRHEQVAERRASAEAHRAAMEQEVRAQEGLLEAAHADPVLRQRLLDVQTLSPEVVTPRVVPPPGSADGIDGDPEPDEDP